MDFSKYCSPFLNASRPWPPLPITKNMAFLWWQSWLNENSKSCQFEELREIFPQLWITPKQGASNSEKYKRLVLLGQSPSLYDREDSLKLNDQNGVCVSLVEHPCGNYPVIDINDESDFRNILRCLAYRCEQISIQKSVHAQAISGLIHWGLIKNIDRSERANLIILHNAPYSSLSETIIPGNPTYHEWLGLSRQWRLEHELTHLATKFLINEMRINLFDELIADCLGMLNAINIFSADIFLKGLGIKSNGQLNENARAKTYIEELDDNHKSIVLKHIINRAKELEQLIFFKRIQIDKISLLKFLIRQQLDQPLVL
tara:strand:- start:22 stop:969 length:948 start_codon:yes stop_codon:yes gene_type:complete